MNNENFRNNPPKVMQRFEEREQILDGRSVLIGMAIVLCLFVGATVWKLAVAPEKKLAKLREFEFTPEPPKTEKFELKEPQRELMRQLVQETPEMREEQRPNIQMSTNPQEVEFKEEVIKTRSMEITPEVDIRAAKLDIQDNLEKADETGAESVDAINPAAVLVNEPGDIYAHAEPDPRIHRKVGLVSTAPKLSGGVKVSPQQFGDQNVPTCGELGPVDINLFGDGDYLGSIKRGGLEMRTAVDSALRWLALHQESDGSWSAHKWNAEDVRPDGTGGTAVAEGGDGNKCGMTAFALIAFMGGGHNLRRGEYRASVIRGIEWLMAQQDKSAGYISKNMYEHAISTIALCEALGRSPDERVGLAARKAVDACVLSVAKDGGWRYTPNAPESDVSVTSWFLQALKTAKLANIKFDHTVFSRGLTYIDQATDKAALADSIGAVGYQPTEDLKQGNGAPALTCAGMVIRQFNGMGVKHPLLCRGAELTRQLPPDWEKRKDFYYWYYATYAMHNMGGEHRLWWNRKIRDTLLDHQSKRGHQAGSWNPKDEKWGKSRVYTTALGALCLEVYDRYGEALQSFGTVPSVDELFFRK